VSTPRLIPSIEQLLQRPEFGVLERRFGRRALVESLRLEAGALRQVLNDTASVADRDPPNTADEAAVWLHHETERRLAREWSPTLRPIINGTGVIVHTNLGRAPLGEGAIQHLVDTSRGYTNLEYDLAAGRRGRRDAHAEALLTRVSGAEAAVVVNNNAAATLLLLAALARGREVVISRGELVEIGGGFRVPDVMAQSGAVLREVGTTNRTRVADYAAALGERTGLILRVHQSNFRIEGFTERPDPRELVKLGRQFNVPVAEDLGGGSLWAERITPGTTDTEEESEPSSEDRHLGGHRAGPAGIDEPTVQNSVSLGYDVVCFSGDKMLGGPQAGILVGRRDLIDTIRRHPLMRAFRVDKLTYAALEGTLVQYATGNERNGVPVLAMLSVSEDVLQERGDRILDALRGTSSLTVAVVGSDATVGGGSAPGSRIPSRALEIDAAGLSAAGLEEKLRALPTPIIGRVERDRVLVDLRTVLPWQDALLAELLSSLS
jgi:L-seryl-tRNA(Ser) seleniumtransferase